MEIKKIFEYYELYFFLSFKMKRRVNFKKEMDENEKTFWESFLKGEKHFPQKNTSREWRGVVYPFAFAS
jgi:hypothetical protein